MMSDQTDKKDNSTNSNKPNKKIAKTIINIWKFYEKHTNTIILGLGTIVLGITLLSSRHFSTYLLSK